LSRPGRHSSLAGADGFVVTHFFETGRVQRLERIVATITARASGRGALKRKLGEITFDDGIDRQDQACQFS
jgi:hypothetical protein